MKVYLVTDGFSGTDADCQCETPFAVYSDEMIAKAVANSMYAHSVSEFEVQTELPEYAREAYEKLKKKK